MTRVTTDAVSRNARVRRKKDESIESHVARVTHMVMNKKQITHLVPNTLQKPHGFAAFAAKSSSRPHPSQNGLQSIPLKSCTTMYLYDNQISQIEGLTNVHSLKDLYLQVTRRCSGGLGLG